MPLIECTVGPVEATVGGRNYAFERDRFMRYVAHVHNARHVACFLGSPVYREVDEIPAVEPDVDEVGAKVTEDKIPPAPPISQAPGIQVIVPGELFPPVPVAPATLPPVPSSDSQTEESEEAKALAAAIQASADKALAEHKAKLVPPAELVGSVPAAPVVPTETTFPPLSEKTAKPAGNRAARRRGKK